MSSSEEIIENAGKEPGLEIWRIEDMELAVVPKNTYGSFYRHGFLLSSKPVEIIGETTLKIDLKW